MTSATAAVKEEQSAAVASGDVKAMASAAGHASTLSSVKATVAKASTPPPMPKLDEVPAGDGGVEAVLEVPEDAVPEAPLEDVVPEVSAEAGAEEVAPEAVAGYVAPLARLWSR